MIRKMSRQKRQIHKNYGEKKKKKGRKRRAIINLKKKMSKNVSFSESYFS